MLNTIQTIQRCAQEFLNEISHDRASFYNYKGRLLNDYNQEMELTSNGIVIGYFLSLGRSSEVEHTNNYKLFMEAIKECQYGE